jgi:hypothetical protein
VSARKLVLAAMEPGNRRIRFEGADVGHCLTVPDSRDSYYGAWQSYLWYMPGDSTYGWRKGPKELRLRELRAALEQLLAESPWWLP